MIGRFGKAPKQSRRGNARLPVGSIDPRPGWRRGHVRNFSYPGAVFSCSQHDLSAAPRWRIGTFAGSCTNLNAGRRLAPELRYNLDAYWLESASFGWAI